MSTQSDAVQKRPTLEEEVARFRSFSTTDGEVSDGKATAEEEARAAANRGNIADAQRVAAAHDPANNQAAGDEDEDEEGDEAGDGQQQQQQADGQQPNKPKKSVQQRINAAVKAQRSAERARDAVRAAWDDERASYERRIADLERRANGSGTKPQGGDLTPKPGATTTDASVAPDPKDFEYGELDTRYIRALARHEARQEMASERASNEQTQRAAAQTAAEAEFATKRAAFEEAGTAAFDDFHEVVIENAYDKRTNPGGYPLSKTIGELAFESEHGPAIVHSLASDVKEARRVFGLTAAQQAAWFGRKEAALSSASSGAPGNSQQPPADKGKQQQQSATAKTTQAPPPVKGARGAGARNPVDASTTDFAAFERLAMSRN